MLSVVATMSLVLMIVIALLAVVGMGIGGIGRDMDCELADRLEQIACHLNGDAQPPQRLVRLVEQSLSSGTGLGRLRD